MAKADSNLEAPILLVAMPQVQDPFFHKSVVLLTHHEEEGSLGFIVNRPTGIEVKEVLEGLEIEWHGAEAVPAYFGGPVQRQLGTVLFAIEPQAAAQLGGVSEILPGVLITQHVAHLQQLAVAPPPNFRLLLGYAGWSAGQLVTEILRNDWLTAPASPELVFAADPSQAWDAAVTSAGFDPAALPSWTSGPGDSVAN